MLLGGYDNGVYQNVTNTQFMIFIYKIFGSKKLLFQVITVNIKNGDIEYLPPLQTPRSELRTVELNGFVYAIGGWDETDQVDIVEMYVLIFIIH